MMLTILFLPQKCYRYPHRPRWPPLAVFRIYRDLQAIIVYTHNQISHATCMHFDITEQELLPPPLCHVHGSTKVEGLTSVDVSVQGQFMITLWKHSIDNIV